MGFKTKRTYKFFLYTAFFLTFLAILIYLLARIFLFIIVESTWLGKSLALLLLFAESFVLIHSIGYFSNIVLSTRQNFSLNTISTSIKELTYYPPIAILVAAYKEPITILNDTLICFYNISYPNKHLYFLDDTRYELPWDTIENVEKYRHQIEELCKWHGINLFRSKWHGAKAGKINDFLKFLAGNENTDFEFHWNEIEEKKEIEKYLIIFDADMNPLPNFAEDLVALAEINPRLAFIQTPQYYTNFETNRVAHAAGVQQAIFYEYICEGKSLKDAMFCSGTNVLFRREALMDVGGFDESSVTEDFSTSLKLHGKGWGSLYINKVLAFGMGPEDLGAYFKQQFRWATGTIGVLRTLPLKLWQNFRQFTINQWWEYFLASTHYLIGWVFFIMIICPIVFLIFNTPSFLAYPEIYLMTYIPYIVISSFMFFWTIMQRKYRLSDLLPALLINIVSFPIFMRASFYALMGIKTSFEITPKGETNQLPFRSFIPQISACLCCVFAITWGFQRLYYEWDPVYALSVNIFWTFYNFVTLSFFLYFNHTKKETKK